MATKKETETMTVNNPYISKMEANLASLTVTRDTMSLSIGSSVTVPKGTVLEVHNNTFNGTTYPVCQFEADGITVSIGTLLRRQCNDRWKQQFTVNKKAFIKDLSEHSIKCTLNAKMNFGTFTRPFYHVELVD